MIKSESDVIKPSLNGKDYLRILQIGDLIQMFSSERDLLDFNFIANNKHRFFDAN